MSASPGEAAVPLPAPAKLRYSRLWWAMGWAIIVGVIYGSLERPDTQQFPPVISDKVIHFSAYALLTIWFCGVLPRRRYPWVAAGLVLFGGAIELAQGAMGFGRDADWHDLLANSLGISLSLVLAYAGLGSWMIWIERRLGLS